MLWSWRSFCQDSSGSSPEEAFPLFFPPPLPPTEQQEAPRRLKEDRGSLQLQERLLGAPTGGLIPPTEAVRAPTGGHLHHEGGHSSY